MAKRAITAHSMKDVPISKLFSLIRIGAISLIEVLGPMTRTLAISSYGKDCATEMTPAVPPDDRATGVSS